MFAPVRSFEVKKPSTAGLNTDQGVKVFHTHHYDF